MCILASGAAHVADAKHIQTFEDATGKFFSLPAADREALLRDLQVIVEEFGLEETIAIDIKHKHFDMPAGYAICEEQFLDEQKSIMKPALLEELGAQPIPFAFILVEGQWKPYEFVTDCPSARDGLAKVSEQPGFLAKLSSFLEEKSLVDTLGFHVLHREHLDGQVRGTIETPGDEEELLLQPYTEQMFAEFASDSGTRQVMWSWCKTKPPARHLCLGCSGHVCNHCGSHCKAHPKK